MRALLLLLATSPLWAAPLDLYVAPQGNDQADGRAAARPLATLARAQQVVRSLRGAPAAAGGIVVHVAGGTYPQTAGLAFEAADAGQPNAPVVWRGEGQPVVVGGPVLRGFRPYRDAIQQLDLAAAGVAGQTFGQLFCNGRRMILARVPNVDPNDLHGGTWGHVVSAVPVGDKRTFAYSPKELNPARWQRPTDGRISYFSIHDWSFARGRIGGVDATQQTLSISNQGRSGFDYGFAEGDRYFVEGIFEELDAPGEWYLDSAAKVLYFWPPEPLAGGAVSIPAVGDLVTFNGTHDLVWQGFVVEGCDGHGVVLGNSERVQVAACTIRNVGSWAVNLNGGRACRIDGCDITGTGSGGIQINGGDRATLTPAGHVADNNYIHHIAAFQRTYNCAINLGGVGNTASHNLIHDTPHAAVALAGNDNVFEFNHVHHTNLQSTDTGGLYSCPRDWTQRGNIIRYNRWHDIGGFGKANAWQPVRDGKVWFEYPHFTWGIYLDDPTSGNLVYGNVLYRVPICGLHNHGGRDNVWENNIVVDCPAFQAGMLAADWGEWPAIYQRLRDVAKPGSVYFAKYPALASYRDDHPEEMSGLQVVRNIFHYTTAGTAWLRDERKAGNDQLLYTLHTREVDFPKNVFDYNLVSAPADLKMVIDVQRRPQPGGKVDWAAWQALGQDRHSQTGDPLFVDAAHDDYRLRPDSPALKLGFKPIPFEQIGLYQDARRATWPVIEAPGASGRTKPLKLAWQLPGFEPVPAREFVPRDGLPRTLAKLRAGGPVKIAYYGGGIHGAGGWRAKALAELQQAWPQAKLEAIDGGITDAVRGSSFSVYRFAHDVLRHNPDLVLVDYASDDYQTPTLDVQRAIEAVVRQGLRHHPAPEYLFLYAFRAGYETSYAERLCPPTVTAYERLADHYGIPSVNLGMAAAALFTSGVWKGGVVPVAQVDEFYTASLRVALPAILTSAAPAPRPLPPALRNDRWEGAQLIAITPAMLSGPWRELPAEDPLRREQARHFDTIWFTNTPGSKLTFTFRGTEASLFNLMGPDTGRVRVTVDGKDAGTRQQVDPWAYYQRLSGLNLTGQLPLGQHTVTVELLPDVPDRSVPRAEAAKRPNFDPKLFEGVALRFGWIRVMGPPEG
ncbi:MAG: right-handed parallel beta-helix repeat-containing protein [Fimbriimonadaceae bacterium]|nr:right-handed parallel beta-helix repeat-containing protein [Fimbriimonadaceae bacterium]